MGQPTKRCALGLSVKQMLGQANVRVVPGKEALAEEAARLFAVAAQTAVAEHGRFRVALSGGSTPQALFSLLAQAPYAEGIPWQRVDIFWGDERLVPPDDPGSNYYHARRLLLDHVPVVAANIHRIRGERAPQAAVADYEEQLQAQAGPGRAWPRFDLALLGLGADGHTASLFPGSPATEAPVITVTADYEDRPAARLSLTPPVFNDARHILFLVSGADKAAALAATLQGPYDPQQYPAQRIGTAETQPLWLVDEAAAGHLAR